MQFPKFRYHPDPVKTGAFLKSDSAVVCQCCNNPTDIYYSGPFYAEEEVDILCPACIANGEAAMKYDGENTAISDHFIASSTHTLCNAPHRTWFELLLPMHLSGAKLILISSGNNSTRHLLMVNFRMNTQRMMMWMMMRGWTS